MLAANLFPVTTMPDRLRRFNCKKPLTDDQIHALRLQWAFRKVSPNRFISFCPPPSRWRNRLKPAGVRLWRRTKKMDSIPVHDLVKDLLRRSMEVACASRELADCSDQDLFYFPPGLIDRNQLPVTPIQGKSRRVGVVGERNFGRGQRRAKYRYHVAPTFAFKWRSGRYEVTVRLRLRITNIQGVLFPARAAIAR